MIPLLAWRWGRGLRLDRPGMLVLQAQKILAVNSDLGEACDSAKHPTAQMIIGIT